MAPGLIMRLCTLCCRQDIEAPPVGQDDTKTIGELRLRIDFLAA
jgi:hypothetical protein